jgi:hypothetical protein
MATNTSGLFPSLPMGRSAKSSSLPPELKMLLNGFGGMFWQFDAAEIAHMLSPTVTPPSDLVDVAYSLLEGDSSDWPKGADDSSFHEPLVEALNDFLAASHRALDLSDPPIIERDARWCADLRFMQLEDGSRRAHGPVKREAVGGISFRGTCQRMNLAIPVKLDEDWPAVVAQAARSVQILYSACHLRKFGLVIGFRHTTLELRFLIAHRGGVSASKPLSVVEEQGKKDILRVFISMLMWRTEEDYGIPESFHDDFSPRIPAEAL